MAVIPKLHTRYSGANENTSLIQKGYGKQESIMAIPQKDDS